MWVVIKVLRNLFETILAQWPGDLATLAVVRWQISEGHRSREHQDKVFLTLLVEHVNREIGQNVRVLKDLPSSKSSTASARRAPGTSSTPPVATTGRSGTRACTPRHGPLLPTILTSLEEADGAVRRLGGRFGR
jgi:hypothetical protein